MTEMQWFSIEIEKAVHNFNQCFPNNPMAYLLAKHDCIFDEVLWLPFHRTQCISLSGVYLSFGANNFKTKKQSICF